LVLSNLRKRLIEMYNLTRLEYGIKNTVIHYMIYYDLLLLTSDREPSFRLYRGFLPPGESDFSEMVEGSRSGEPHATVPVIDVTEIPKVLDRVVYGLENEEYAGRNFEDSDWKIHSLVNVVVTAVSFVDPKRQDILSRTGIEFY